MCSYGSRGEDAYTPCVKSTLGNRARIDSRGAVNGMFARASQSNDRGRVDRDLLKERGIGY